MNSLLASAEQRLEQIGTLGKTYARLVLAKRLLDQAMTYLRYHIKTLPGSEEGS